MYNLYLDIERSADMKYETKAVDKAESFMFYTRNQFNRELRYTFELDQSKTLKYQILGIGDKIKNHYSEMIVNSNKL